MLCEGSGLVLNSFDTGHGAARETEELFAENRDSLVRYLRHHLSDFAVAEDIAQESFIRFFQARTQGEDVTQPRAWLFRVAHNLLIDFGRKKKPDLLDSDGEGPSDLSTNPKYMEGYGRDSFPKES